MKFYIFLDVVPHKPLKKVILISINDIIQYKRSRITKEIISLGQD